MTRQSQRGVTLIEMLVVIAIIGVLAGLATGAASMKSSSANPAATSDQIAATMQYAHQRAASSRRIVRVQVTPSQLTVWQSTTTGLGTPTAWQALQTVQIPKGNVVWNAQAGVQITSGSSPSQNTSLSYAIDFRPDGVTTGSTVYVTDNRQSKKYRVLVYHATGGSYAREYW